MTTDQAAPKRRRGGGRAGAANRRGSAVIEQMPWKIPHNNDRPTEPLPPEGVAAIHDGAMRILEEIGIEILNPEALEVFRKQGCTITGENVRMDREMLMSWSPLPRPSGQLRRATWIAKFRLVARRWCLAMCPARQITGICRWAAKSLARVSNARIC